MYYEDLGLCFHGKSFFNVENPVTRDELWHVHSDDGWEGEGDLRFICIEFNVRGLTADEIADLEREIRSSLPSGEYTAYLNEGNRDTGDREIGGLAGYDTYADILSILRAYDVEDIIDRTTYA